MAVETEEEKKDRCRKTNKQTGQSLEGSKENIGFLIKKKMVKK